MNVKIRFIYTLIAVFGVFVLGYSQEDSKPVKKVVIIKKINENGKVTETRQEAEGEEADKLINSLPTEDIEMVNVEKNKDGKNVITITKSTSEKVVKSSGKEGQKEIEVTAKVVDGKTKEKYKIIRKDKDGNEKVMEWDGDGEMPAELAKELEVVNINKNMTNEGMEITIDADDSDNSTTRPARVIVMDKALEVPEGKKGKMTWHSKDHAPMAPSGKMDKPNNNRASLGVMIEDTDNGVVITDLVEGSAAAASGLRRGDVLLKVNNTYIFTSNGLIDALHPFNPGDKVKVRYIREGKEKSATTVLKARN